MYSKDEAKKIKKSFWEEFSKYTKFYSNIVGEPIHWVLYKTGISGIDLKFDLTLNYIAVVLEINNKNENKRFDKYVEISSFSKILAEGFNNELVWSENFPLNEKKIVSRIYVEKNGLSFHNKENWPAIFKFMASNMYKLQSNFMNIQPILQERINASSYFSD